MLAGSDWLETDEGDLHGHDQTKKVEGNIGYVDPECEYIGGGEEEKWRKEGGREGVGKKEYL